MSPGRSSPAETPFIWQSATITRGYTFHEQLDSVALVHMNGRVYDPKIGRFLPADPFIQDITNSQALNAYAYVNNNPLSYTDPSGFFLSGLFKPIGNFFRSIGRAFASAAKAIVKSGIGRAILQIIACANPAAAITCPAAAAGLTLAAGGSLKEALFAAAISFGQMGAYSIVGSVVQSVGVGTVAAGVVKLGLHAVVGGAFSVAQGGSFMTGAFTGAIAAGTSLMMEGAGLGAPGDGNNGRMIARTAIAAIAGGTASVLSGGKFANGAITGAMAHLFNQEGLGRTVARGVGAVLGGFAGGTVAAGATGVCASATGGACAIAAPEVVGGGIALGAATGSVMMASAYDAGGYMYDTYVHGNSLASPRQTSVYELVGPDGSIQKFGITSAVEPEDRYSRGFYKLRSSNEYPRDIPLSSPCQST